MLMRANYAISGNLEKKDFIGETAAREMYDWIATTAMERDTFQYLGKTHILNPITWNYTDDYTLEIWKGLVQIGEPDMLLTSGKEIRAFFERHLNVVPEEVHPGDSDVCEKPHGWFMNAVNDEDFPKRTPEPEEISETEIWMREFFEEKNLPERVWSIAYNEQTHVIENYDMIEIICEMPEENRKKIQTKLEKIDLVGGDINKFLKYLAEAYIETYYS